MKKLNITIVLLKVLSKDSVRNVVAEDFDEFTWYVTKRFKGNEDKLIWSCALIDKQTGLMVVNGKNKQAVLNAYEKAQDRYEKTRSAEYYKKLIEEYQELLKGEENE